MNVLHPPESRFIVNRGLWVASLTEVPMGRILGNTEAVREEKEL